MSGTLYIVATPIGNLKDIAPRALDVLRDAALVAVEDTRHSRRLLLQFGIATPLLAVHDFNEDSRIDQVLRRLEDGDDVALISDAGTPLISDPGFRLVRAAQQRKIRVTPVPGPCALIAALSCSGLPTDSFTFEGFLPAKTAGRKAALQGLRNERRTMIFYEAPHRIAECLADMRDTFGAERRATMARELTKTFETVIATTLGDLEERVKTDSNQQKGEIVLVVAGQPAEVNAEVDAQSLHVLRELVAELPVKQAAALASRITGVKKNVLYAQALQMKPEKD